VFGRKLASGAMGLVVLTGLMFSAAAWLGGSLRHIGGTVETQVNAFTASLGFATKRIQIVADPRFAGPGYAIALTPTREAAVRAALLLEEGESLFAADPARLQRQVQALDFVETARVLRLWPDTVMVLVAEVRPAALARVGDTIAVVSANGTPVSDLTPEAAHSLPGQRGRLYEVRGEGAAAAAQVLTVALEDFPEIASRLTRAERVGNRRWDLVLTRDVRLSLPEDKALEDGLAAARALMRLSTEAEHAHRRIDLRVQGRAFIRDTTPNRLAGGPLPAPASRPDTSQGA
jgi:cell division protein FtsQ